MGEIRKRSKRRYIKEQAFNNTFCVHGNLIFFIKYTLTYRLQI